MVTIISIIAIILALNLFREHRRTRSYRGGMGINPFCTKADAYKQCSDRRNRGWFGMRRSCVDLSGFNAYCPFREEPERPLAPPPAQAPAKKGGEDNE